MEFTRVLKEVYANPTGYRWESAVHSPLPQTKPTPLMPPDLCNVLDLCPTVRTWKTRGRPPEPDRAGLRDRAVLLVGFVAALRRSEISALDIGDIAENPSGLVLTLPRSKTNQHDDHVELVVLPRGNTAGRCPVTVLNEWIRTAGITDGPVIGSITSIHNPNCCRNTSKPFKYTNGRLNR